MKTTHENEQQLAARRQALKAAIGELGDLRPGQLTERYRRCGKPNCHCATPGDPGHGPCFSLTRVVAGKTKTRVIPAGPAVAQTQAQLEEYRHFRRLSRELVEVSEALCEASLKQPPAAADAAKKKGSKKTSRPRSRTKSKR